MYRLKVVELLFFLLCFTVKGQEENSHKELPYENDSIENMIQFGKDHIASNWVIATESLLQAEKIATKNKNFEKLIEIYDLLTLIHFYETLNYGDGLSYTLKGLDVATQQSDTLKMIRFNRRAGIFHSLSELYPKAKDYFLLAQDLNHHYGNLNEAYLLKMGLLSVYWDSKEYDDSQYIEKLIDMNSSMIENKRSQSVNSEIDYNYYLDINYSNMIIAYLRLGDYTKCKEYIDKILDRVLSNKSSKEYKVRALSVLSVLHSKQEKWGQSVYYADSILAYAKMTKRESLLKDEFYYSYSKSLSNLGENNKAIEVLKERTEYLSSTIVNTRKNRLINSEVIEKIKNNNNTLKLQRNEALYISKKNRKKSLIFLVLFIITLLVVFIFRFKLQKNKLAKELLEIKHEQSKIILDKKNREITSKLLQILDTGKMLKVFADEIKLVQDTFSVNNQIKKSLDDIRKRIIFSTKRNVWKEFEIIFEEVHPSFYEKLYKVHPDLSRSESILCAYLKLNLESKKIAAITGNSVGSVEVSRARLRKKLRISNKSNINLYNYIQNI